MACIFVLYRVIRLSSPKLNCLIGIGVIIFTSSAFLYVYPPVPQSMINIFCGVNRFTWLFNIELHKFFSVEIVVNCNWLLFVLGNNKHQDVESILYFSGSKSESNKKGVQNLYCRTNNLNYSHFVYTFIPMLFSPWKTAIYFALWSCFYCWISWYCPWPQYLHQADYKLSMLLTLSTLKMK